MVATEPSTSMSTPPDPSKGGHRSDTLVNDRPPIDEEREEIAPFKSDEATAINHQLSDEESSSDEEAEQAPRFDPARTLAGADLYVDSGVPRDTERDAAPGEISGKNAVAPVSGPTPRAPEAPTLVHQTTPIEDDDDDDILDATERLTAPPPTEAAAPATSVGPLPERSPGASVLGAALEPGPMPEVQQWRVVPTGQSLVPPPSPREEEEPPKPRGLQTVLWNMQPMADDDEDDEVTDHGREADPYPMSGGTVFRAAQTYVMEAMDLLDQMKDFGADLDDERSRELLANITGCADRMRRALALLAAAGDDGDE
jgi:hypothetical protein